MMNDFEQTVFEMRQAQRVYFRHRTREALIASKELEKKVDALLKQAEEIRKDKHNVYLCDYCAGLTADPDTHCAICGTPRKPEGTEDDKR